MNQNMPLSPLHQKKRNKNIFLFLTLISLVLIFFVLTITRLSQRPNTEPTATEPRNSETLSSPKTD
jgi:hypothetical protein